MTTTPKNWLVPEGRYNAVLDSFKIYQPYPRRPRLIFRVPEQPGLDQEYYVATRFTSIQDYKNNMSFFLTKEQFIQNRVQTDLPALYLDNFIGQDAVIWVDFMDLGRKEPWRFISRIDRGQPPRGFFVFESGVEVV